MKYRYKTTADFQPLASQQAVIPTSIPINNTSEPFTATVPVPTQVASAQTVDQVQVNAAGAGTSSTSLFFIIPNHIMHNFSTTLLALPDSPIVENMSTLGKRLYWQDNNNWDGTFPLTQYFLIIVNLGFISMGISSCWRKHRLAGLAPVIIFIFYDISLGFAVNSGSRYIVPINWVVFFYYGLGFFIMFKNTYQKLSILPIEIDNSVKYDAGNSMLQTNLPLARYFVVLVVIGLILPIANWGIPALLGSANDKYNPQINMPAESQGEFQESFGYILYPYYNVDKRTITFDFQTKTGIQSFTIIRGNLIDKNTIFDHDQPAIANFSFQQDVALLNSISFIQNGIPALVWHKKK